MWLFLVVSRVGLQCVIVVFPDHTHLLSERVGCFTLFVFLVVCNCYCSVALPFGVVGWSSVCYCGIS